MPRAGLNTRGVVDAALAVVDGSGAETLTLAAIAARAGVSTPSLYKHVTSLSDVRQLVGQRVLGEVADLVREAVMGRSGDDAVAALMRAWRSYVRLRPHRYAMMPPEPLGDPLLQEAGQRLLGALLAVIGGYGLEGPQLIHAARRMRAATHGFVSLEAAGGFGLPEDLDESFESLIAMVCASMRR